MGVLLVILFLVTPQETYGEKEVIKVGYSHAGAITEDGQNTFSGYTVEYLEEIAKYTGWEYEYVRGTWEESVERLKNGEIDILGLVNHTEEREQDFIFSELSIADDYTTLLTTVNSDIYYKDYDAFNGCRVGVVKGTIYEQAFRNHAAEQGFTYSIAYFSTSGEAKRALLDGQIDMMAIGGLSNHYNLKAVDQFDLQRTYFITGKQNQALMDEMDEAIQRLRIEKPDLISDLTEKYYNSDDRITNLHLTREEKEYVDAAGTIVVKGIADRRPLGYEENGEFTGILADYLELVAEYSGLDLKLEITEDLTLEDHAAKMVEEGYAFLYVELPEEMDRFDDTLIATEPLFESSLSYIKRQGDGDKQRQRGMTFALIDEMHYLEELIYAEKKDYRVQYYDTSMECMEALVDGEADITIQDEYVAAYLLQKPKYAYNLAEYGGAEVREELCLYIPSDQEMLAQIINKTIGYLAGEKQTDAIAESMVEHAYEYGAEDLIYEYGRWIGLSIALLAIIVILGIMLINRIRKFKAQTAEKEELQEKVQLDELTGVYNRQYFFQRAAEMLEHAGDDIYIVRLNICYFKVVNDLYGSDKGDHLLQEMGSDLKKMSQQMNFIVGRFNADHFYLCIRKADFEQIDFPQRSPAPWLGMDITLSYGVYPVGNQKDIPISAMCDRADMANKAGRADMAEYICYYSDGERQKMLREQEIEREMDKALEERQFCIFIQPKYDIKTGNIVGGEALVRWKHPQKGMISPGVFIDLFERNGFIKKLDYYVWEECCRFQAEAKQKGLPIYPLSINVSRIHFYGSELLDKLTALLQKYGLDASEIELEATESVCAEDPDMFFRKCAELRAAGFQIAMDDFGSGYSSLNMLKEMPLDIIKMDLRFLTGTETEEQEEKGRNILRTLIQMAHTLELKVVVEGVETEDQVVFIRKIGNCAAQGYYYSRPVECERYEELLTKEEEDGRS